MKVLFDTNILFSAYVQNSVKLVAMIEWVSENHEAVITEYIASEAMRTANLKAPHTVGTVATLLISPVLGYIHSSTLGRHQYPRIQDPNDQPILNAAIDNDVDIIVTGDKHFHALKLDHPRIMSPADFIAEFIPELL